ncbi:MAG TPA: hypothetical protein VM582_02895 [Candidatus Thermoplasmatota archaeon]|nr:hypothetical protein [Candidatus Thermoplasmatota archaeon]
MIRLLLGIAALAVVAGYVAATASAQAVPFGFDDDALDAMPPTANAYADLVGGRMELLDGERLRATLDIAVLQAVQPGLAYGFLFSDGARDWYVVMVNAPSPIYFYGLWDGEAPETVEEAQGSYTLGAPGEVVVEMPLAALGDAAALTHPRGITADGTPEFLPLPVGLGILVLDAAEGEGTLPLPRRDEDGSATAPGEPARDEAAAPASSDDAAAPSARPAAEEPRASVPGPGALAALAALALAARRRAAPRRPAMRWLPLLALLALATPAAAQDAQALSFADAALDATPPPANAWADIVAGRLERPDEETLVATLELALLPEMQPGVAYLFLFSADGREWFAGAATTPSLAYFYGRWESDESGLEDLMETTGAYSRGPGGAIRVDVPLSALGAARTLSHPRALVADIKLDVIPLLPVPGVVFYDRAAGEGEMRVARGADAPTSDGADGALAPAATGGDDAARAVPAGAGILVIGGLAAALLLARRPR